jgi:hypothetical protein
MRRTATGLGIALAAVGLSVALVGCGGSVSAADASKMALASSILAEYNANVKPVDAAFMARAEAICGSVLDYNASHPNPYPSFDYNHPDVATMKSEGAFFSASPFNTALAQLIALPAPQTNAASWTAVSTAVAALRAQLAKQIAAALAGDAATFTSTIAPIESLSRTLPIAAHQAGFADTSSCVRLLSGG